MRLWALACAVGAAVPVLVIAADPPAPAVPPAAAKGEAGAAAEDAKMEYRANDMLAKGIELLEMKQEERAVKMIASVPQMFPKSKARFKAYLALGNHYAANAQQDLAVKQYEHLAESDNVDDLAQGLYRTGIAHYNLGNFDKSFVSLRRVTTEFPWSVYANESYFYIGQCHFKLGRWAKAVEALEMVGTSVDPDAQGDATVEGGQRMYVKVFDRDLVVLRNGQTKVLATLATKGGDREQVELEPLGRSGEYYIASIMTTPADPKPGDGTLQIVGGDTATIEYVDHNTDAGKFDQKRTVAVKLVSTATVGFTDGAFREYTKGVFGDQDCFIRVRDLDRDTSKGKDVIRVNVLAEYKVEQKEPGAAPGAAPGAPSAAAAPGADASAADPSADVPQVVQRGGVEVELTETESHSGIFVGTVVPHILSDAVPSASGEPATPAATSRPTMGAVGSRLNAAKGDDLVVEYLDEARGDSPDPVKVRYAAKLLVGQIQDVKVEHRVVDSLDLKARKNLIEAKMFLKLGGIFKEVGLIAKAGEKANEGLDRVEDVISTSLKSNLDRSLVEEAFSVKWDLLLVQDKLAEAIRVCHELTRLFPDSTLVDRALLKIGQARMEGNDPGEAITVFNGVLSLPKSDLKAEAQYNIGQVQEKTAVAAAETTQRPADLSGAMLSYKKCAEQYPNSPFAGESLDRIVNYYITAKDYPRAVELMEQVFQDYPDASFLDKMLLKYVVAAFRMGNFPLAKQKAEQLMSEYPGSKWAETARGYLDTIKKKSAG